MIFLKRKLDDIAADGLTARKAPSGATAFRAVSWLAVAAALAMSLYVFWRGWNQPLLEMHGFRQTQTALTVYWLLQGGDWLAYETPVLGAPWSVPMEFPIYQWAVALATYLSSASIDHVGRLVSYGLFLLCLFPIRTIFREAGVGKQAFPITAALLLAAPIYLFWSRTFMIESAALFFALSFVALHLRWFYRGHALAALGATIFAVLAVLTKVTTFPLYGVLAIALSVEPAVQAIRSGQWRMLATRCLVSVAMACVALLALIWWVKFSDQLKALNMIGEHLMSDQLTTWNFGTYEQRFGNQLWVSTVRNRAIPEAIGSVALLWVAVGVSIMLAKKSGFLAVSFLIAWATAFLTFTNLHIVHNYYQYSNAALLIAGLGLIIAEAGKSRPLVASILLVLALFAQWNAYGISYRPIVNGDFSNARTLQISDFIKRETPKNSAILVLGYDWSSEVSYYSRRKALTLPGWAPADKVQTILSSPASFVQPLSLSAVVYCRDSTPDSHKLLAETALSKLAIKRTEKIAGCDVFLISPE